MLRSMRIRGLAQLVSIEGKGSYGSFQCKHGLLGGILVHYTLFSNVIHPSMLSYPYLMSCYA